MAANISGAGPGPPETETPRRLRGVATALGVSANPRTPTRSAAPGRAAEPSAGPVAGLRAASEAGDPLTRRARLRRRAFVLGVTFGEFSASGPRADAAGGGVPPSAFPPAYIDKPPVYGEKSIRIVQHRGSGTQMVLNTSQI